MASNVKHSTFFVITTKHNTWTPYLPGKMTADRNVGCSDKVARPIVSFNRPRKIKRKKTYHKTAVRPSFL